MQNAVTAPNDFDLDLIDRYWRAANYLSVGQIYLMDNPLLRQPLKPEHIKPRLLGHWGTTPGLNFVYAHLNRIIRARDLDVLYVCGPGHGGPVSRTLISKAPIARSIRRSLSLWRECGGYSDSSPFREVSRAMSRRKHPVRSMKAANSAMRLSMLSVRCSTIQN